VREEVMEGVRKRTLDFWEMRSGMKACRVVKGARRRAFRASDQVEGDKEAIDLAGKAGPGTRTKALKCRVWNGAFGMGCCCFVMWVVNLEMASFVESGCVSI